MARKLFMFSFLCLSIIIFTSLPVYAEVHIPLNVDLKQKIPANIAENGENDRAVVSNNTIYIPEGQGNKITAINALDGSIKWEYSTNAATAYYQFTAVDDILFFQANGTLTVLKDNGTEASVLWTKPYQGSQFTIEGSTLYFFKGGKIAAVDVLTGSEKWEYSLPTREKPHSNIVIGNGKVYFVTDNQIDMERKMYALNAATAQALWTTTSIDYYAQKLSYSDGKLYVKSYKEMNAFDATNGTFQWKFLVQENFDFEMNANTIFTKTSDGNVSAYDRTTKALLWKVKVGSSSRGPIIVTPMHIVVNSDGSIKWLDIKNGQISRTMTAPGENYQPFTAVDGALVAIDSSYNLYYYTAANDTEKPSLVLDKVPNRFSPYEVDRALIHFSLSEDSYIKMSVKNSQGQVIRTIDFGLVNGGWVDQYWDGKDDNGQIVPYGLYTLSFQLKDLAGNEATIENTAKKINIADGKGTTVNETVSRKGPGTTYDIQTTVPVGTQLIILDETTDWFKVSFYVNSIGYEGYIQKSVVATRTNPNPSSNTDNTAIIYSVQSGDTLWKIAQKFGVTAQAIVDANNLDPTKYLYVGQKLTIPVQKVQPEQPTTVTYTVQSGDTLWKVGQKYGVTAQAIVDANNLDPTKYLYVGQKLTIPVQKVQPEQPTTVTYTVQSGDTLWKVAQKYGVTAQAIVNANKLDPAKYLYVGQKLIIPTATPEQPTTVTYTVQPGDTLWKVAQKYGVTSQAIVAANKLDPTKYLYVGQKLIIPAK